MKEPKRVIHLLGYASALGGVHPECGNGPLVLQKSKKLAELFKQLSRLGITFKWDAMLRPSAFSPKSAAEELRRLTQTLALSIFELSRNKEFFIVTGGDHTSALGTWSGVREALNGPLGLIWIDAHMDSHTPETSVSGRLHGMPLASLLGYGEAQFSQILSSSPKINPEHLCLIGVRSYEAGEARLLKKLKVRVFFMKEVRKRGLPLVFKEALELVTRGTAGYGLSLDLDSLDPQEAPGVDVPEPDGLSLNDLSGVLRQLAHDPRLVGLEVVEFNPNKDLAQRTEKAIATLIQALIGGR